MGGLVLGCAQPFLGDSFRPALNSKKQVPNPLCFWPERFLETKPRGLVQTSKQHGSLFLK